MAYQNMGDYLTNALYGDDGLAINREPSRYITKYTYYYYSHRNHDQNKGDLTGKLITSAFTPI